MTYTLDPEIAAALVARAAAMAPDAVLQAGTVFELRALTNAAMADVMATLLDAPDVEKTVFSLEPNEGGVVPLNLYSRRGAAPGPLVIYVHGGGMVCGSAALYERLVRRYVHLSGVAFLAVGYRLAPELSTTGLAQDVVAALRWLLDQANALGVDPQRIAIMGDSGGGGVAAAAAILARDAGLQIARQILVYPMLDDRNVTPDPLLVPYALWSYDDNRMAWTAVLGDAGGGPDVSPSLAPARLIDCSGLAPAYIEVGEMDIFRDECIQYAARLLAAGISCELHVFPGAPHAYDQMCPDAAVTRRALAERLSAIGSL